MLQRQQQQAATRIGCSDGDVDSVAGTAGTVAASCHRHLFVASGSGTGRVDRHHFRWSGPSHLHPRTEQRSRLWPPRTESSVDGVVVGEEGGFGDFVVVVATVDGTPRGTERWPPPPPSSAGSRTPRNRPTRTLPKTRSIGGAGDDRNGIAVAVWVCRHLLPQPQECHRQVAAWWC